MDKGLIAVCAVLVFLIPVLIIFTMLSDSILLGSLDPEPGPPSSEKGPGKILGLLDGALGLIPPACLILTGLGVFILKARG